MTGAWSGPALPGTGRAPTIAGSAVLIGATTLGAALPSYREGPPPAHTGGFGEPTCAACHFGAPLNDDGGSLTLDAPDGFRPGARHRLEVRLARADLRAAGFQLAVRFADGPGAGAPAGTLAPIDDRTAVIVDSASGIPYAYQTLAGSDPAGPGVARWTLEWMPPDTVAVVVIHVAANAANDDASEFGDFIYTAERRVPPAGGAGPEPGRDGPDDGSPGGASPGDRVDGPPPGPTPFGVRSPDRSPRPGMKP